MAVLVALMVLVPPGFGEDRSDATVTYSIGTDNRGNSFVVDKLATSKYPLCCVLMELTEQMRARGIACRARWTPRGDNQPADDLTNEEYGRFQLARRVPVEWSQLEFRVLDQLMVDGARYIREVEDLRTLRRAQAGDKPHPKRKRGGLRETDPW